MPFRPGGVLTPLGRLAAASRRRPRYAALVLAVTLAIVTASVPFLGTTARTPQAYRATEPARFTDALATIGSGDPSRRATAPSQLPAVGDRPGVPATAPLGAPAPTPAFDTVQPPGALGTAGFEGQIVNPWQTSEVSWYGPDLYGGGTACGLTLTLTLVGVAHRTLPCGTLVQFRWGGNVVSARVVDRGPYIAGRLWDLTYGLCALLNHCWTGPLSWRIP